MSHRISLKIITVGALAVAAMSISAIASAARDRSTATTEFSAEDKKEDPKKKKAAPKSVAPRQTPQRVAPRQITPQRVAPRQIAPREHHVTPQSGGQKNIGAQKKFDQKISPATAAPRIINPNSGTPRVARKVFTPRGQNSSVVSAGRIRSAPARGAFRTSIRGRNYSVWRSGYRSRYHGGWRTFVALDTLGILAIGASEYYPYAYIDAPEDYCDGLTEDGCQMVFDEVQTEEGDAVAQCVAYCPWQ